jgi:hypothetical protein
LNFVDANQLVFLGMKEKLGIFQFAQIGRLFKVKINCIRPACDNVPRQSGFSALAWPEQSRNGKRAQRFPQFYLDAPLIYLCNL